MSLAEELKAELESRKPIKYKIQAEPYEVQLACWIAAEHVIQNKEPRMSIRETVDWLKEHGLSCSRTAWESYLEGVRSGKVEEPQKDDRRVPAKASRKRDGRER